MDTTTRWLMASLLFLFCQGLSLGQVLTLEGAVEATIAQYPTLAAQRSALEAIRANLRVVRDNRLPNVRLHNQMTVGTANGLSGSYFSLGLIVPTSGARRAQNRMDLASGNIALGSLDWEVYNFGRFSAEEQLARAEVAIGEAGLEAEQFGLRQMVISTYLELLGLQQLLAIEQRNLARADTVRQTIVNLVRNGVKPGLDSLLASVQVSNAKLAYWQVLQDYREARIQLATLTGRSVSTLQIDTTFSITPLLAPTLGEGPVGLHPLLRLPDRLVTRQTAEIDLIRKSVLPRVSLLSAAWARGSSINVENEYGSLASGLAYSRSNFLVGVAATMNLTDLRRKNTRIQLQELRVQQATNQLAVERLQLQNSLITADSLLAVVRLTLTELPTALNSAQTVYNQRLSLYNNGVETILGLTDALELLSSIEKNYVNAQSRAARLQLQRAYASNDFEPFYTLFRR